MEQAAGAIAQFGLTAGAIEATRRLLTKLVGHSLEEVGEVIADQVRAFRFKNQVKILERTNQILSDAGIEPRSVPMRTLAPMLEGASWEDDDSMVERWAALIANAASSEYDQEIPPSFATMLRELSPKEALALDTIFDYSVKNLTRTNWHLRGIETADIATATGLADELLDAALDNLIRLRLASTQGVSTQLIEKDDEEDEDADTPHEEKITTGFLVRHDKPYMCLTMLGYRFVTACRPPTAKTLPS